MEARLRNDLAEDFKVAASHHFHHRDEFVRFLADVIATIFLPLGLVVWGARALSGKSVFFSTAKTNREEAFESVAINNASFNNVLDTALEAQSYM